MRNLNLKFLVLLLAFSTAGCSDENEPNAVPVAPILKEVVMPAESKALPGTTVTISGKGFDVTDKLFCESLAEELDFAPEIASVNDQGISFAIPMEAAGPYAVKVERAGLTSRLPGELKVPYIIVIDGLSVPSGNVARGAVLAIRGKGFEAGDQAVFSSDGYPGSTTVATGVKLTQTGIEVTIPEACYGVNTLTVVRGTRQANLGRVNVAVSVGDEVGGGIVYYTSDNGTHGLIVKRTNTGSMTAGDGVGHVPSAVRHLARGQTLGRRAVRRREGDGRRRGLRRLVPPLAAGAGGALQGARRRALLGRQGFGEPSGQQLLDVDRGRQRCQRSDLECLLRELLRDDQPGDGQQRQGGLADRNPCRPSILV